MRLIDADELMEKFKEWIPKCGSELLESGIHPVENLAVSALMEIEEAPTIEAEPKWIPCSQALPNKSGAYLVTINDYEPETIEAYYYSRIKNWGEIVGCDTYRNVIAWMEEPEPYKGEE